MLLTPGLDMLFPFLSMEPSSHSHSLIFCSVTRTFSWQQRTAIHSNHSNAQSYFGLYADLCTWKEVHTRVKENASLSIFFIFYFCNFYHPLQPCTMPSCSWGTLLSRTHPYVAPIQTAAMRVSWGQSEVHQNDISWRCHLTEESARQTWKERALTYKGFG